MSEKEMQEIMEENTRDELECLAQVQAMEVCDLCGCGCDAAVLCDEGIACETCAEELLKEPSPCVLPKYEEEYIF